MHSLWEGGILDIMNPCKRYTVTAEGFNGILAIKATNGNEGECTGEIGNCGCTHAEINLLRKMPDPIVVIVSHSPCLDCARALVAAGVMEVQYGEEYRKTEGIDYLIAHGVKITKIDR